MHTFRLDAGNAAALVAQYDVVADGSDNFETRYAVADACAAERPPAGARRRSGVSTARSPCSSPTRPAPTDGRNPSYRDLFPEPPPAGLVPSCAEAGVLGALTGVIGTLQAMEVIKLITGIGEPLVGRLLLYDALAARFDTIRYKARG